ncbi:MAG: CBS domain-containing protein [bacterium]
MGESIKTKAELIRLFLKYPISSIPLVSEKKKILGFLSKQDIIASSGVKDDLSLSIDEVIKHHLNPVNCEKDIHFLNLLLKNFNKVKKLPVMDEGGNIVDLWEKFQFLTYWEGEDEKERVDFYARLFDSLPVGIVITSASFKILYLNPIASSFSKLKGKKIGRDFSDVFNLKIEPPALRKKEGDFVFTAGYIKNGENVEGIIYIIYK